MRLRQVAGLVAVLLVTARLGAAGSYDPKRDPERDLRHAVDEAQASGKRILVVVGGEWCSWCKILDRFVNTDAEVGRLWNGFVTLHVNYSEENDNAAFLRRWPAIPGYPHIFVLDKDGRLLHSQDTSALERGKGYSKAKMIGFLQQWKP